MVGFRWRRPRGWAAAVGVALLAMAGAGAVALSDLGSTPVAAQGRTVTARTAAEIQPAIDSVRSGGGAVHIVAGRYELSEKIRIYSNVTVFGDGMGQTVLVPGPGMDDHLMSDNSSGTRDSNIVIRDLTLDGLGRQSSKTGCCHGLRLVNQASPVVERVESKNNSKDGIYLGYYQNLDVSGGRVSGCRTTGNGRNGISLTHGRNNVIEGCIVKSNNRLERVAGIDLEPDQGLTVADNKVRTNKANRQNVGVQLFAENRDGYHIASNAVCYNKAKFNSSAGIWDFRANGDVFVGNVTLGSGTDLLVDGSAKVGDQYAGAC